MSNRARPAPIKRLGRCFTRGIKMKPIFTIFDLSEDFHSAMMIHWRDCGLTRGGFLYAYCGC